ncbi:MAG: hypothetical protein H6767_06930 [Candidatus Peribacteria bacterium]|nr:MAG: hypothetical protein H6767_06930 [Candidatus Peribacteria bacterium]
MYKKVLYLVFILGSLLHAGFMFLNTVLKEADSFAYLQMASYLEDFSLSGL